MFLAPYWDYLSWNADYLVPLKIHQNHMNDHVFCFLFFFWKQMIMFDSRICCLLNEHSSPIFFKTSVTLWWCIVSRTISYLTCQKHPFIWDDYSECGKPNECILRIPIVLVYHSIRFISVGLEVPILYLILSLPFHIFPIKNINSFSGTQTLLTPPCPPKYFLLHWKEDTNSNSNPGSSLNGRNHA